jgi:putative ABC transport system ATP-binding protein
MIAAPAGPRVAASGRSRPLSGREIVVAAENIHKAFRRGACPTPVLAGVDLDVQRGECLFLIGPSGSGKSTLLSILGCSLAPDRGRVVLLGRPVAPGERVAVRRRSIGFVFQNFQLIRGLSALDNVCVPLMLQGVEPDAARRRARDMLADVGLEELLQASVDKLSAGQCQRVALARALANDPALILADEPTAALDEETGQHVMQLLRTLIDAHGKTAIIVTHDPRISHFADRILALKGGLVVPGGKETRSPQN